MKKDGKTTLAGFLKAGSALLALLGVTLSPENQETIIAAAVVIYSTLSGVQAYFTKDAE